MSKDYYKILGVEKGASEDDIKKAYRTMAHKYHPDKKGGDEAKFKEVNEAYQVLGDKQKRTQYDQFGSAGFGGAGGPSGFSGFGGGQGFQWDFSGGGAEGFADIFEDLFGGGFGGQREATGRQKKGADLKTHIEISLLESAFGETKEMNIHRMMHCDTCEGSGAEPKTETVKCHACQGKGAQEKFFKTIFGVMKQQGVCDECLGKGHIPKEKCKKCHGEGVLKKTDSFKIKIPQSIEDGETFKIPKKGNDAPHGGASGSLFVSVSIKPHKDLLRNGDDLIMNLPINFTQAVFGDKVEIETLYKSVQLKIPEGVQSGKIIKVASYGMPKRSGFGKGDMLVKVNIKTPEKLTKKQKTLLEELKKEGI
ncbi:molecular chaperone DnaJ [Candidatus Azambacteria bacterium]|nr:molecular chaperone DnaJ [Candidatus Azambacteria bacterium]